MREFSVPSLSSWKEDRTEARRWTGNSIGIAEAIMTVCNFSRYRLIVDVGGGQARCSLLSWRPMPEVAAFFSINRSFVARAEPVLRKACVADRCETVAGSFLDGVPSRGDAYLLKGGAA
jgi:hypothetical protein